MSADQSAVEVQPLKAPNNRPDYLFFTFQFADGEDWVKGAVAQEVLEDAEGGGEFTGAFRVLLQSEVTTYTFKLLREYGQWIAEPIMSVVPEVGEQDIEKVLEAIQRKSLPLVPEETAQAVGELIDKYLEAQALRLTP